MANLGKDAVYVQQDHYLRAMLHQIETGKTMWLPGEDNILNGQEPFKGPANQKYNWKQFQRRFGVEEHLDSDVGDQRIYDDHWVGEFGKIDLGQSNIGWDPSW